MARSKYRVSDVLAFETPFDFNLSREHFELWSPKHRGFSESWRGPHAGKEISLLFTGIKRVALFSECEKYRFMPFVEEGKLIYSLVHFETGVTDYIVGLPGEEERMNLIKKYVLRKPPNITLGYRDMILGTLFGYSKYQIRKFIGVL